MTKRTVDQREHSVAAVGTCSPWILTVPDTLHPCGFSKVVGTLGPPKGMSGSANPLHHHSGQTACLLPSALSLWNASCTIASSYVDLLLIIGKELPANAGGIRDSSSIPGLGRFLGDGHGNPLQYSCLENPMDRGAWRATVLRAAKSWK